MKLPLTHIKFYPIAACFLLLFNVQFSFGQQKIDVDSLLQTVILDIRIKEYDRAIANAQKGIQLSPNYLDFYQFLGRAYQLTGKPDLAREQYKYVIDKNPKYIDVFSYWIGLEMEQKNYEEAEKIANLAIEHHPDEESLYLRKWGAIQQQGNEEVEYNYLVNLPDNIRNRTSVQQQLGLLEINIHHDRIGVNYAITTFDRNGVGPGIWVVCNMSVKGIGVRSLGESVMPTELPMEIQIEKELSMRLSLMSISEKEVTPILMWHTAMMLFFQNGGSAIPIIKTTTKAGKPN